MYEKVARKMLVKSTPTVLGILVTQFSHLSSHVCNYAWPNFHFLFALKMCQVKSEKKVDKNEKKA